MYGKEKWFSNCDEPQEFCTLGACWAGKGSGQEVRVSPSPPAPLNWLGVGSSFIYFIHFSHLFIKCLLPRADTILSSSQGLLGSVLPQIL